MKEKTLRSALLVLAFISGCLLPEPHLVAGVGGEGSPTTAVDQAAGGRGGKLSSAGSAGSRLSMSGAGSDDDDADSVLRDGLVQFSPMYSAFDGTHEYQVTPSVPSAAPGTHASDPVLASTLAWQVDETYVKLEPFPDLPGAVLLTTKKPGTTTVKVVARTLSGVKVRGEAALIISDARLADWDRGEVLYNSGAPAKASLSNGGMTGSAACGLPSSVGNVLPKDIVCANCHNSNDAELNVQLTPTQTASYSDAALLEIVSQGTRPARTGFQSQFFRMVPMPDCVFKAMHAVESDPKTLNGLVLRMRSIAPKPNPTFDAPRLAASVR